MAAIIFGLIILLTLVVGLSASRGQKASKIENYLVGGRSFGGLLFFFFDGR